MSYDDELRAHQEHLRLGQTSAGRKYLDARKLTEEVPEPYVAPDAQLAGADVTHEDIVLAVAELARETQTSYATVNEFMRQRATGRSAQELAVALAAVAGDMLGPAGGPDDGMLALAAGDYADPGYLRDGHRRFPVDTPEKVTRSWRELHECRHEYSADDFGAMHGAIEQAAGLFGITLHDPCDPSGGLSPEGTPSAALAAYGGDTVALSRRIVGDELLGLSSSISAEERRELAARGEALEDGSYPVPDVAHLKAAAVLCRSKHGDWRAAEKLIARRAKELGVPNPLASSGPVAASASTMQVALSMAGADTGPEPLSWPESEVARLTAENPEVFGLAASASGGGDTADTIAARHPELAHLFKGRDSRRHDVRDRRSGKFSPVRSGQLVTTRTRAHSTDPDSMDRKQPAKSGKLHPEVERILREHGVLMGVSSNTTYPVKSPEQREAEEARARAGHQGSRSIPDLDRHSQRGSNTTWGS